MSAAMLMDWIVYAESTGIRMLQQCAKTLRFHAWGIPAYCDYPISTGPLEGIHDKIKTMKRQAYWSRLVQCDDSVESSLVCRSHGAPATDGP
jgi:transposase